MPVSLWMFHSIFFHSFLPPVICFVESERPNSPFLPSFANSVPCGGARGGAGVPLCPRGSSGERDRVGQPDRPAARVYDAAGRGLGGRVAGGAVRAAVPPQAGTHGQRGAAAGEREEEQIPGHLAL